MAGYVTPGWQEMDDQGSVSVNPAVWNTLRRTSVLGQVQGGVVRVLGTVFAFEGPALPDGTDVEVRAVRNYEARAVDGPALLAEREAARLAAFQARGADGRREVRLEPLTQSLDPRVWGALRGSVHAGLVTAGQVRVAPLDVTFDFHDVEDALVDGTAVDVYATRNVYCRVTCT